LPSRSLALPPQPRHRQDRVGRSHLIVEHKALDAVRTASRRANRLASKPARTLKYEYQSAQGNNGTAAQIACNTSVNAPM
jgi:putative ABC transport system substrate-binding protein